MYEYYPFSPHYPAHYKSQITNLFSTPSCVCRSFTEKTVYGVLLILLLLYTWYSGTLEYISRVKSFFVVEEMKQIISVPGTKVHTVVS